MTTLVVIPIEGDSPRARTQSCKRGAVSRLLGSCVSEVCRDAGARDTVGSQLSRPALWLGPRPSHSTRAVARVRALADLAPRGQRHHHSAAAPRGAPRASFGEGGTAAALGPQCAERRCHRHRQDTELADDHSHRLSPPPDIENCAILCANLANDHAVLPKIRPGEPRRRARWRLFKSRTPTAKPIAGIGP